MSKKNLLGSIDAVRVGKDFINIEGWVCKADKKQAETPVVFSLQGLPFSGFGLNLRPDLANAGIANGVAGFNILIPQDGAQIPPHFALELTDLSGATCTLAAAPAVITTFTPSGAIDGVTSQIISGWIFNPVLPLAATPGHDGCHAHLFFEDEYVGGVVAHLERIDLAFDLGDGMKVFGFEVSSEGVLAAVQRLAARMPGRDGRLSLVASGLCLSVAQLRWSDNKLVIAEVKSFQPAVCKVAASDHLSRRWFKAPSMRGSNARNKETHGIGPG